MTLRPDRHGTTRAVLSSVLYGTRQADARGARRSVADQKARLHRQFANVGWQAQRILDALEDADDMYYETIAQVKAQTWSRGRVVLAGDAAWCASPVSGMETSLSLVGAYVRC